MNKLLAISFCAMLLATACNSSEEPKSQTVAQKTEVMAKTAAVAEKPAVTFTTIDWNKAFEMSKAGAVLIDVRTPSEVEMGKASPEAINIPLQEIQYRLSDFPKDKDLLIYCRSGTRSKAASNFLIDNG